MTLSKTIPNVDSICPECGGNIFKDQVRGEQVCKHCGLIVSEKEIETKYERRMYNSEERKKKSRLGDPHSIFTYNINAHTRMDTHDFSNTKYRRLRKLDNFYNPGESRLIKATIHLTRIGNSLRLPMNIKAFGMYLFRKLIPHDIIKGRSLEGFVAAALYCAARFFHYPITIHEIIENSNYGKKTIYQSISLLVNKLKLKLPRPNLKSYILKYLSELGCDYDCYKSILKLMKKIPSNYFIGKKPMGIIAALIYLVFKEKDLKITQNEIATLLGVTENTLRTNLTNFLEMFGLSINFIYKDESQKLEKIALSQN